MSKQINLKSDSWCVKNDGSQLFKDTVVKWLYDNYEMAFRGIRPYYGISDNKAISKTEPFGTVLTLSEFIELAKVESESVISQMAKELTKDEPEIYKQYMGIPSMDTTDKSEPARDEWVSVKDRLPTGGTTGHWDGAKSNPILAIDKNEVCHVCVVYHGTLDGNRFADFYTLDDYEVPNITHWRYLPEPPNY